MHPTASAIRLGDSFGSVCAGGPSQVVAEKKYLDDGNFEITTNLGIKYVLPWDKELVFPIRQNGKVKDWRGERPPAVIDLYVGDVLPNFEPRPKESLLHAAWYDDGQRVTGMRTRLQECIINTFTMVSGIPRIWCFELSEPVQFPRIEYKPRIVDRDRTYGPYLDVNDHDIIYQFQVHPYGAGRWPRGFKLYERQYAHGTYLSRPPQERKLWKNFMFTGEDRHPSDPVLWRREQRIAYERKYRTR